MLNIIGGLVSAIFLFTEPIPYFYRVFYLTNGFILALVGSMVVYGVIENRAKSLEPFLGYQMLTLTISSVSLILALFSETDKATFIEHLHQRGRHFVHADISPDLMMFMLALSLLCLFLLPSIFFFIVLRCYVLFKETSNKEPDFSSLERSRPPV
ncbi:hypothetical protein L596_022201 [Steinernema carpocapsae]|uniref:Uncharacterized protein n=1 Tax=Steinernema carpocapsae TaxID=34508 RepID=A0A4U5MLW1_STECR|nr:hypothetical protein L596_022201 [Steinernema carpocapsae]